MHNFDYSPHSAVMKDTIAGHLSAESASEYRRQINAAGNKDQSQIWPRFAVWMMERASRHESGFAKDSIKRVGHLFESGSIDESAWNAAQFNAVSGSFELTAANHARNSARLAALAFNCPAYVRKALDEAAHAEAQAAFDAKRRAADLVSPVAYRLKSKVYAAAADRYEAAFEEMKNKHLELLGYTPATSRATLPELQPNRLSQADLSL